MIVGTARTLLRVALVAAGALLIGLAVLTLGARLALPLAAGYKGAIETHLGERLGHPVTIGELDLRWRTNGPVLRIEEVSVLESATRGVTFDELLVDVDLLGSLLRATPILDELTLVGADLSVEYSGGGEFRLHGVERMGSRNPGERDDERLAAGSESGAREVSGGGGLDLAAWLLDADRVGLLDTRVTIVDSVRDRRLVVRDLNVRVENEGNLHRLRIELELPPELGGTLEAGLDLQGSGRALMLSDGSVYVRGSDLHLGAWQTLRDEPPTRPSRSTASVAADSAEPTNEPTNTVSALFAALARLDGDAEVELWGRWKAGEIHHARIRLDARDLLLQPAERIAERGADAATPTPLLGDRKSVV